MYRTTAILCITALLCCAALLEAADTSFQVSDVGPNSGVSYTRVVVNAAGNALIVWREYTNDDYTHFPIRCRLAIRQPDGSYTLGDIRTIVTEGESVNHDFDIANQPNGQGFIIIWVGVTNLGESDASTHINVRLISANGASFGPVRTLYSNELGTPSYPVIATDPTGAGGYMAMFNYSTLPGHSPGIYGVRLDRKGRAKGVVFRIKQADVMDGKAASYILQHLHSDGDGSFIASAIALFTGPVYKSFVARIPAGTNSATSAYLQQTQSLLIDAAPVATNRAVAVGSVNKNLTGQSSYASLKLPSLKAKKARRVLDFGTISGTNLLSAPDGGAWLIYSLISDQFRAQWIDMSGSFQGQALNLFDSAFVTDFRSASLLPNGEEVFIGFTRRLNGIEQAFVTTASLAP